MGSNCLKKENEITSDDESQSQPVFKPPSQEHWRSLPTVNRIQLQSRKMIDREESFIMAAKKFEYHINLLIFLNFLFCFAWKSKRWQHLHFYSIYEINLCYKTYEIKKNEDIYYFCDL